MENPKPEPISQRVFPHSLPEKLTQEEEAARIEFHKLIKEKLAAQHAAVKGISIVKPVDPEQSTEPEDQEPEAQILYTNNIKPSNIYHDLKNTSKECMDYLRKQVELASAESQNKNAMAQAVKQEKARQRQIALASRKKVTPPTIVKDLVESTFAATQSAQAAFAHEAAPTLLTMPTLNVSVESMTKAVVCYPESIPQDLTHSAPAASVSYDDLDALLASVDMVASKRVPNNIPNKELDQLLADLESFSPQSTNPLYEEPAAELGPIQQVEVVDIFTSKLEDIERKVTELSENAHVVFKGLNPRTTDIRYAHDIIQRSVTEFNQEIDKLSHQIKTQAQPESLSAFTRLKALTNAFKASAESLSKENKDLLTSPSYLAYTISMQSLLTTLNS